MTKKKLWNAILLIINLVLISSFASADLYLNSKIGNINLNTTGQTRLQITPGGNLDLLGLANVSIPGNLSVGGNVSVDGNTFFVDSNNNRVGIGTTAPLAKLHLSAGVAGVNLVIARTDAGVNEKLWDITPTTNQLLLRAVADDYSSANNFMTITRSGATVSSVVFNQGNVGIGTTTPGAELTVARSGGRYITYMDGANIRINDSQGGASAFYIGSHAKPPGIVPDDISIVTNNTPQITVKGDTGKVGIGTTSPATSLDVNGQLIRISGADTNIGLRLNGSGSGQNQWLVGSSGNGGICNVGSFCIRDETPGTTMLVVQNETGNVGIGTTTPARKLEVIDIVNQDILRVQESGNSHTGGLGVDGAGSNWGVSLFQDGNKKFTVEDNAGLLIGDSYQSSNAPADGAIIEGNVGIGTTSPGYKLVVDGGAVNISSGNVGTTPHAGGDNLIVEQSGAEVGISILSDNDQYGRITFGDADDSAQGNIRFDHNTNTLSFDSTSGADDLVIDSSGDIGIGTTDPSQNIGAKFLVISDASNAGLHLVRTGAAPQNASVHLNTAGHLDFYLNESNKMRIEAGTGFVGIGTSSPDKTLDIVGNEPFQVTGANPEIYITNTAGGSDDWAITAYTSGVSNDGFSIYNVNDVQTYFLIEQDNGHVGIGTITPAEKLSINGNVSIEGTNCRDSGGVGTCDNFVDIAELFPSSEKVESGDVIILDLNNEGNIKKSFRAYDASVAGVVSTQPAIVIEGNRLVAMGGTFDNHDTLKPAIALAGRVPVKVTNENGAIESGDLLTTSSKPGYAMKFSLIKASEAQNFEELQKIIDENEKRRNSILGKSLEFSDKEDGKIIALVTLQ